MEKGHVLYEQEDFTPEEYERGNILAVAVIDGGLSVCKICGQYEAGLHNTCRGLAKRALEIIKEKNKGK